MAQVCRQNKDARISLKHATNVGKLGRATAVEVTVLDSMGSRFQARIVRAYVKGKWLRVHNVVSWIYESDVVSREYLTTQGVL